MRLHLGSCLLPAREADVIFEGYPIRFCLRALEEHHLLICAVVDVHERQVTNQPPVDRLGTVKGRAPRGLLSSRIPGFHENFPFPRAEDQAPGMQRCNVRIGRDRKGIKEQEWFGYRPRTSLALSDPRERREERPSGRSGIRHPPRNRYGFESALLEKYPLTKQLLRLMTFTTLELLYHTMDLAIPFLAANKWLKNITSHVEESLPIRITIGKSR